jgi:hypothetical protein
LRGLYKYKDCSWQFPRLGNYSCDTIVRCFRCCRKSQYQRLYNSNNNSPKNVTLTEGITYVMMKRMSTPLLMLLRNERSYSVIGWFGEMKKILGNSNRHRITGGDTSSFYVMNHYRNGDDALSYANVYDMQRASNFSALQALRQRHLDVVRMQLQE